MSYQILITVNFQLCDYTIQIPCKLKTIHFSNFINFCGLPVNSFEIAQYQISFKLLPYFQCKLSKPHSLTARLSNLKRGTRENLMVHVSHELASLFVDLLYDAIFTEFPRIFECNYFTQNMNTNYRNIYCNSSIGWI